MKNALLILVILVAGCAAYQQANTGQPAPQAEQPSEGTINAVIEGFSFTPATIRVKSGSTVIWAQKDSVPHTVTLVSGPEGFDSGTLSQGRTFSKTFTTPGTYEYQCSIHPSMRGTIVVE